MHCYHWRAIGGTCHIRRFSVLQFWLWLHVFVCCRLKAYDFLGRKINLSGISPAKRSRSGPNSVYVDMSRGDNVQGILGAIGPFWTKWGWDESRGARVFCVVIHATFRQLRNGWFSPNLVTKRTLVSRQGIRKDIFENFHFRGHLPQKNLKSK